MTEDPDADPAGRARAGQAAVALAVVLWTAGWAWSQASPSGISWHYAVAGARDLFGAGGLRLYARHPELQMGPLTFVAVAPLRWFGPTAARVLAQILMTAAGPAALWLLAPLVREPRAGRRRARLLLAGLVLAPPWTALAVRWAHPDDVLAMLLAVLAVRCVATGRAVAAGTALAAAVAAKPWAVGFLPILASLGPAAPAGFLACGGGVLLGWLPFLVQAGTLGALRPPVGIADASPLRLFGVRGDVVPTWTRTVQLLAAPAAAVLSVLCGRWPATLLVAVAVRIGLDPQANAYYAGSAVLAALVVDLLLGRRLMPWSGLVTGAVMWQPFVTDYAHRFTLAHGLPLWWFRHQQAVGILHLTWALVVVLAVAAACWRSARAPAAGTPAGRGGNALA